MAQALLAGGVLDELRFSIAPAVVGTGRRLLDGMPAMRMELVRSVQTPSGYLLADYRVVR